MMRSTDLLKDLASIFRVDASPGSPTAPRSGGRVPEGPPGDPGARGPPGPGLLETVGGHQGKTLDPLSPRQLLALRRRHQ